MQILPKIRGHILEEEYDSQAEQNEDNVRDDCKLFHGIVLCFVLFEGDDPFDDFIEQGGIDTIYDELPALDRTDQLCLSQ